MLHGVGTFIGRIMIAALIAEDLRQLFKNVLVRFLAVINAIFAVLSSNHNVN